MLRQQSAAPFIPLHLFDVLPAVELDHEPALRAAEISNEFSNRELPPEFNAVRSRRSSRARTCEILRGSSARVIKGLPSPG
jgi:hypothetical protein